MRSFSYAGNPVRVLGESEGIAFRELTVPAHVAGPRRRSAAVLPASGPPDPEQLADIYRRHRSEIVP